MTTPPHPEPVPSVNEPPLTLRDVEDVLQLQHDAISALQQEIATLRGLVTAGGPGNGGAGKVGPAPRWYDLRGPDPHTADTAADQWAQLTTWTSWLLMTFPPTARDLPPCWPLHSPLVEEVTALWAAHSHAYRPGAGWDEPLRWHEALHAARKRWKDWNTRSCTDTHKRPTAVQDLPAPTSPAVSSRGV